MILTGTRIRVVSQIMGIAIAALTLTSFSTKFAQAQGFSVSPVRVEADVPGGRGIEIPFELSNSTETQVFEMTVTHVELLQAKDGSWLFEETDELFDPERHNSNRTWFSNANQTITVGPQQSTNIVLEGEVPRDARGGEAPGGDGAQRRQRFIRPRVHGAHGTVHRGLAPQDGAQRRRPH